jgi:hypothetical protein
MINHIEKEKKMTTAENPMQKIIARCWEDEEFKRVQFFLSPGSIGYIHLLSP